MRLACHNRPTETDAPSGALYFSRRLPEDLTPSATAAQLRRAGAGCNLMQSNPELCGFTLPADVFAGFEQADIHAPDPLGLGFARAAVADYIAARYLPLRPEHIMLTAGTSEAYGLLFKLLTDPGDAVVAGTPGYPLVQHLAELEHLRVLPFETGHGVNFDIEQAESHLARGARLVVLIVPNNPTGRSLRPSEAAAWAALAARYRVPLVVDHVFGPYAATDWPAVTSELAKAPLLFMLDGVSKAAGLPRVKLGWIAVRGAQASVDAAMERLAWLGDAYLSVSHVVQHAAAALMRAAALLQPQINARLQANRSWLADALAAVPEVSLLPSDGGWYGVLRLPQSVCEDELVITLARRAQVQLHPGYFYDFPRRGHLVTGLLLPPEAFAQGWRRALQVLADLYK